MHMAMHKRLTESIRDWLAKKLILVVGIALGVAFLISTGPLLQQISVALFDVSQPSLYKSIFPSGIVLDAGPKRWLLAAFETRWIVTGVLVALIVVHMASWWGMLIALGVAVAGGLTIVDVMYRVWYGPVEIDKMVVDITANILGGVFTGVIFFLVLWTSLLVGKAIAAKQGIQTILTAATATIFGAGISLILYIAMGILVQPVEVEARVLAQLPLKGTIGQTYAKEEGSEGRNKFRFTGELTEVENVILNGAKGLSWEWMRVEKGTRFSTKIYVVGGCTALDQVKQITKGQPILEIENTRRLGVDMDGFVDQIALAGKQKGISVDRGTVSQFWIDNNDAGDGVVLTEFLSDVPVIQGNTDGDIVLLLTSTMAEQREGGRTTHPTPRTVKLQVNDEFVLITFRPGTRVVGDEKLVCRHLKEHADC